MTLIGGFISPLYTKTGSVETCFRYPNVAARSATKKSHKDSAQDGWVGG